MNVRFLLTAAKISAAMRGPGWVLPQAARQILGTIGIAVMAVGAASAAESFHPTSGDVPYKCIFNHELLIISGQKNNSPAYIGSFIDKLKDTDVDAVICCPGMWRTNLWPSEIDPQWKQYTPDQVHEKFPSFDRIMGYIHDGGDPVKDTLEACRRNGKDFFVSYRMNDHHYTQDLTWPSHNAFWREHPQYWFDDTNTAPSGTNDHSRLFNYLHEPVRDYYFSILQELCTKYDVDGIELDFQRYPKFFPNDKTVEGTAIMTAFVQRIRTMTDRIGRERGKKIRISVRIPETLEKCTRIGLDVAAWDAQRLVDMVNVSSCYMHTTELGIEGFRPVVKHAKLYGEMNYVTTQNSKISTFARRYTTPEIYRASALNLFSRGVDGLSLFNFDYLPKPEMRLAMTPVLRGITDVAYLKTKSKDYVIYPGFGTFPATNERKVELVIGNDMKAGDFKSALLRVETKENSADLRLAARLNGQPLELTEHAEVELFPPVAQNAGYASREAVKFFAVPLSLLTKGRNQLEIANVDRAKRSCSFFSVELGLYK
jgi:hypothetical protein